MPDTFTVKVHGLEELERELNSLPEKFAKTALRTGSRKAGLVVRNAARAQAPIRTGALREGIAVSSKVIGEGVKGATILTVIGLRSKVWYGRLIEFGWKFGRKTPFLGPAFETVKERMVDVFKLELGKAISRIKVKNRLP